MAGIVWMSFPAAGYPDIYRYINKEGVMCFTNVPTASKYRVYIREKQLNSDRFPMDQYDHIIVRASDTFGVPFSMIKAMIKVESDFNPKAVSLAGAMGLMQIMPENFMVLNLENPFDPYENIMAGSRFFKNLLQRYNDNFQLAIAAYNAGPGKVDQYNCIPPIKETREYVSKVMKFYYVYNRQDADK